MTSNLIAFWNLQEKEREAAEEMRHNLETEKLQKWAQDMERLRINMDYTIKKQQLAEQERANRASERLGAINAYWTGQRIAIEQEYNRNKIALEERKRVQDSYLSQKKMQQEKRLKERDLAQRGRELEIKERAQKWKEANDIVGVAFKLLEGGLALND